MPTFKAGEVIVEWRADLSKLKTATVKAEKISRNAGNSAGKKYRLGFDKGFNGTAELRWNYGDSYRNYSLQIQNTQELKSRPVLSY